MSGSPITQSPGGVCRQGRQVSYETHDSMVTVRVRATVCVQVENSGRDKDPRHLRA